MTRQGFAVFIGVFAALTFFPFGGSDIGGGRWA